MFKGSYNRKYDDYICVDQLGGLIRPNRVTQRFADLIKQYGLRKIRFHDLRHPYVKRKTKKFANPFGARSERFSQHPVLSLGAA